MNSVNPSWEGFTRVFESASRVQATPLYQKAALQKRFHGRSGSGFESDVSIAIRHLEISAASMQVGQHRRPDVRTRQPCRWFETLEDSESLGGPFPLRHGDSAIQFVERGRSDPFEERVALHHLFPSSFAKRWGEAVLRRDSRLRMISGKAAVAVGHQRERRNVNRRKREVIPVSRCRYFRPRRRATTRRDSVAESLPLPQHRKSWRRSAGRRGARGPHTAQIPPVRRCRTGASACWCNNTWRR